MRKRDELTKTHTCMASAHPNEMVFVLLGRDLAAPATIRAWVDMRIFLGKNAITDDQIVEALACAKTMEDEGRKWVNAAQHYPPGMGDESRRLHREYNELVRAQGYGAKNGELLRALTNECADKGIVLVPGGEDL